MRNRWLDELLTYLPKDRLHTKKKLSSITPTSNDGASGPYTLHFEDGTAFEADAVIGCDGAHSKLRQIILADHPDLVPSILANYWDARGNTTPQKAAEQFGTELFNPEEPREVCPFLSTSLLSIS